MTLLLPLRFAPGTIAAPPTPLRSGDYSRTPHPSPPAPPTPLRSGDYSRPSPLAPRLIRKTTRVLRGIFVFRLFLILFGILVLAVHWSALAPPETLESPPRFSFFLVPTLATTLFLLIPGLERRIGDLYLPVALVMAILVFSLESGFAYLYPTGQVLIRLPSGQEINLLWVTAEMILFKLAPCMLAGVAYGLRGAVKAATLATLIHLVLGVVVWLFGAPMGSFVALAPLRIGVLYAFPLVTGYLSDTWRREHITVLEANRQLRGYAATIEHLATSRERVRLARDLHDTLAHTLAALVVQLEAVDTLQETDPAAAATQLKKVERHARAGLGEARRAILDLRSSPVEELGLSAALERLAGRFAADYTLEGEPAPLPSPQAQALYRIAQEALDNAQRHAEAGRVAVSLCYSETDGIILRVQDDGQGFDPAEIDPERVGLTGIYERAALIGAEVTVDSAPDKGTILTVQIPE